MEINERGEVINTKEGSASYVARVPWPSVVVAINGQPCSVDPTKRKADIVGGVQSAPMGSVISFTFECDAATKAKRDAAPTGLDRDMSAPPGPPAGDGGMPPGMSKMDQLRWKKLNVQPHSFPTATAETPPGPPAGSEGMVQITLGLVKAQSGFGMRIVQGGRVDGCVENGCAELGAVPVPSTIVGVNGHSVGSKEEVFRAIQSSARSRVDFTFLATPTDIEAAKMKAEEKMNMLPPPPPSEIPPGPPPLDDAPPPVPAGGFADEPPPTDFLAPPSMGPRFEGWMNKWSDAKGKKWQGRFFVLDDTKLTYFKGKDAQTMFDECDQDHSGYLDRQEIKYLCQVSLN